MGTGRCSSSARARPARALSSAQPCRTRASYDLLEADTFRELSARPESLRQTLDPRKRVLVVDEIQKLPLLLDEIQLLLDRNRHLRVVLTGSSARKLKRGAANLLGGRAWVSRLHPLVSPELGYGRLLERLERGGLPAVLDSAHPREDLKAYVGTYLREEIQAEGLTRSIHGFSRFLDVAGLMNGEQVNYTAVASDAGVPASTVREHYQILEDTLLGYQLPAYQKTASRKPVANPRRAERVRRAAASADALTAPTRRARSPLGCRAVRAAMVHRWV